MEINANKGTKVCLPSAAHKLTCNNFSVMPRLNLARLGKVGSQQKWKARPAVAKGTVIARFQPSLCACAFARHGC